MKNTVLMVLIVSIGCINNVIAQRKYVDLTNSDTINSETKLGWSLEFRDEFQTKSYYNLFSSSGCWDPTTDKFIVIRSDHDWCWYGDFYGKHTEPEII